MQRYDRQERLWSKTGQKTLQEAHVWANGRSIAMYEALKNLTLAGLGRVILTFGDRAEDTFFDSAENPLDTQLRRMNPSLCVEYSSSPPDSVDLILTTAKDEAITSKYRGAPRLVIGSNMMQGLYWLDPNDLSSIPIFEPHPASGLADLRFHDYQLWPEYRQFCDQFDLENMSQTDHRHVPFCVLITKALQKGEHSTDLRSVLKSMQKYPAEDNFDKAIKYAWRVKAAVVPPGLKELVELANSRMESTPFWSLVRSLGKFIEKHQCLPVSGVIPDMESYSADYTKLKEIYERKASQDAEEIIAHLDSSVVPMEQVRTFCKNSRYIRALVPQEHSEDKHEEMLGILEEFKQSRAQELPPVSAFIGGIAAQEAIKLLLGQYTPLNELLLFDGATQNTKTLQGSMRLIN